MDPMLMMLLATIAPKLLGGLFGGGDDEELDPRALRENQRLVEQKQTALPSGYQSPLLGMADMFTMDNLTRMLDAYSGAGFPSGGGWGSPFTSDILKALSSQMPLLLQGVQGQSQAAGKIRRKNEPKATTAPKAASSYDKYDVPYNPPPALKRRSGGAERR